MFYRWQLTLGFLNTTFDLAVLFASGLIPHNAQDQSSYFNLSRLLQSHPSEQC